MMNKNKCRVCLVDGAKYAIFEDIEAKDSIFSKLFQCFKEKVEDIEGYPQKICESCKEKLDTVNDFITKYKTSCKLLESGLIIVKNEVGSDYELDLEPQEHNNNAFEMDIFKNEPLSDSDGLESHDNFWDSELPKVKKQNKILTEIKAKLKNLKDIKFKKKRVPKILRSKPGKVASSILEAEFDWNGESLKSSKVNQKSSTERPKGQKCTKLVLPKLQKKRKPHPPQMCDLCGDILKGLERLQHHKQTKHFNHPTKCPQCPKTLVSEYYLNRHLKRAHSKTKEFICDTCGRGFAFKGELATHTKIVHLRLRKMRKRSPCPKCNKTFVSSKSLLIHDRSAHTGIRPAECEVCGASFFHEDYLKEHMRLHTGETPFKCPICGRGYAQRGNMRSHMSHNHRLADLSPEVIKTLKPSWFKFLKKP